MQEGPGNDDARITAVDALAALARSIDVRDRADAGHALAAFAEMAEAQAVLTVLLLDDENTFVTLTTAEALLRRKDTHGLAAVAAAFATADSTPWCTPTTSSKDSTFPGTRPPTCARESSPACSRMPRPKPNRGPRSCGPPAGPTCRAARP